MTETEISRLQGLALASLLETDRELTYLAVATAWKCSKTEAFRRVHGERIITSDQLVALVELAGWPAVARAMAQLAGGTFVPGGQEGQRQLVPQTLLLGQLMGELQGALRSALDDGEVDAVESAQLLELIDEKLGVLADLRSMLQGRPQGAQVIP